MQIISMLNDIFMGQKSIFEFLSITFTVIETKVGIHINVYLLICRVVTPSSAETVSLSLNVASPEQSPPGVSVSAVNVFMSEYVSQTTTDLTVSCELRKKSRLSYKTRTA